MMEFEEKREIEERKEKIKSFFKNKENLLLFLLISFAALFKLYFFIKLGNQPIWWDEGDYLAISKVWALDTPQPEWWGHFTGMRPLLIPIAWFSLFKLGFGEIFLRFFTILLPSILSVYIVYLLGKDLYNKYVGLSAGLMMSVYWVFSFYSYRLLTDIPATFFGLLSFYFFWSRYVKRNKPSGLYLCLLFGVLGFSTRFPIALVPISCAAYLLFVRKFKMIKDKVIWKAILLLLIFLLPYIIYFIATNFGLFSFYFGESAVSMKQPIQWNIPKMLFSFFLIGETKWWWLFWPISLAIGLLTFIPLLIGFDIVWKQKDEKYNSDLFVLIWLIIHLLFYMVIFRAANDRWLLMLMPAIFFIASKGIHSAYDYLKRYPKIIGMLLVIVLLFGGVYQNITHSTKLIELRKGSYGELSKAGLWLKENTPKSSKIITASIVQNQYYSERDSYDFYTNDSIWKSCTDLYGALSGDEICQKKTEEAFNKKVALINPDYYVISVFEPVFTPQWAYTYPQRYNLTFMQAYVDSQNNPVLVIYKFNK